MKPAVKSEPRPAWPPRNFYGSVKLLNCLVKARARLDARRKARISQLRDEALAAEMERWLLTCTANAMERGAGEMPAKARLLHHLGFAPREAVELAAKNTPGMPKLDAAGIRTWLKDIKLEKPPRK